MFYLVELITELLLNFSAQVFNGNTDPYTVATNILVKPVYTRYVRVYPVSWNDALVLKLELYGCLTA